MRRRDFIVTAAGAWLAWPLGLRAQQPARTRRIGIIVERMRTPPYDGFLQGLRQHGYVEGRDHYIDWRFANGRFVLIPGFVEDFAKLKVDVIFTGTSTTANAVRQATRTIPIVMGYAADPVGEGLVTSLARPGGNVTGMASAGKDPAPRQLELLAALVPGLTRVALLRDPESADYEEVLRRAQEVAQTAGVTLVPADTRGDDLDAAFAALARSGIQALMVAADGRSDGRPSAQHERLAALALKHRLPSIASQRGYPVAGGLMSCGEELGDFYRQAAAFVDRIFKGARPAELPIEQPAKFHLAINRTTAAALNLAIPPQLAAEADEVFD